MEMRGITYLAGILFIGWLLVAGHFWSDSSDWCSYARELSTSAERSVAFDHCARAESFSKAALVFALYSLIWTAILAYKSKASALRWNSIGVGVSFIAFLVLGLLHLLGIYLVRLPN